MDSRLRPLATMVRVVLRKVWQDREGETSVPIGREYVGNMIRHPVVGKGLVVFIDPHGHALHRLDRVVTGPIRRVRGSRARGFYIDTDNSIYHLTIGERIMRGRRPTLPPFEAVPEAA